MTDADEDLLDSTPEPTETSPAHAGRPRDEAREQAILDAAIAVLAEVGYDRMTMDAVAAKARASKATIYRRWPGKAQLVVEATRRRVVLGESYPDQGSLETELRTFVERVCLQVSGLDGSIICGLAVAARTEPELACSIKETFDETLSSLDDVIVRAKGRGELGPDAASAVLFEVIPAMALMHAMKGEPLDEPWIDHVTADIALPLVRHAPTTPPPLLPPPPPSSPLTSKEHTK